MQADNRLQFSDTNKSKQLKEADNNKANHHHSQAKKIPWKKKNGLEVIHYLKCNDQEGKRMKLNKNLYKSQNI